MLQLLQLFGEDFTEFTYDHNCLSAKFQVELMLLVKDHLAMTLAFSL